MLNNSKASSLILVPLRFRPIAIYPIPRHQLGTCRTMLRVACRRVLRAPRARRRKHRPHVRTRRRDRRRPTRMSERNGGNCTRARRARWTRGKGRTRMWRCHNHRARRTRTCRRRKVARGHMRIDIWRPQWIHKGIVRLHIFVIALRVASGLYCRGSPTCRHIRIIRHT